jgi:zinc/manganese transport system ATP-binding protein
MTTTTGTAARPAPALRLTGASLRFGTRTLWDSLDLELAPGEFVALLGSNGTGKSALLKVILGLQPLTAGSIEVDGAPARRGSDRIGYIPQERRIEPPVPLRAGDLVALGLRGAGRGSGRGPRAQRRRVTAALAEVGAGRLVDVPVQQLSGGEQQRVRIAQALATDPMLLLCDEPLLSLDVTSQDLVVRLIDSRRRSARTAVLFVSHEINPVLPYVDRVLYLSDGRFRIGSVDEVMTSASLSALYGSAVEVHRAGDRILVAGAPQRPRGPELDPSEQHR